MNTENVPYKVKLEVFEGPLDLLLYLIKKEEIDIYDIPIAKITAQYLEYLELMQLFDLQLAGEFLVVAATLMQIKSRMLLPLPEGIAGEEEELDDPRAELVRRLIEYKKFKEASAYLERLEEAQSRIFYHRLPEEFFAEEGRVAEEPCFEATLFDLITAFSRVLRNVPRRKFMEIVQDEWTVEEKVHYLLHLLVAEPVVYFSQLCGKIKAAQEIIATFLAMLELVRLQEVSVRQDETYGEIQISRSSEHIQFRRG